jgi:hypothetical protein
MKTVTVMNVLNEQKQIFENGYDLTTNLISAIIFSSEDSRRILDDEYRNYITQLAKIEYIKSINGTNKVYSPVFDMIAYES